MEAFEENVVREMKLCFNALKPDVFHCFQAFAYLNGYRWLYRRT